MTSTLTAATRLIEISSKYRALVVSYFLIALAIFISHGHYNWIALVMVLIAVLAFPVGSLFLRNRLADLPSAATVAPAAPAPGPDLTTALARDSDPWAPAWRPLAYGLLFFVALGFLKEPGIYYRRDLANLFLTVHLIALAIAMAYCIPRVHRVIEWGRLPALVAAVLVLRIAMIVASPKPVIDVWYHLQEGTDYLWQGLNPYSQTYTNPYQAGARAPSQSYLPTILLALAPFRKLGDVRYGLIFYDIATALLLLGTFRRLHARPEDRPWAELWALLFLFFPRAIFVTEQSWNESVPIFFISLWMNLAVRQRPFAAAMAFGLLLSCKQYLIPLAPIWFLFVERRWKYVAVAAAAAATLPLFFLVQNAAGFLWSTRDIASYLANPMDGVDALTINAFLVRNHQTNLPAPMGYAVGVAMIAVGYLRNRGRPPIAAFLETAFMTYFAMFIASRRAYCNYYYFIAAWPVCLAIVLSAERLAILTARDAVDHSATATDVGATQGAGGASGSDGTAPVAGKEPAPVEGAPASGEEAAAVAPQ